MDDLPPFRSVLVMLFWFSKRVIRLDSDCMELLLTEDNSNKWGGVIKPSSIEDISNKQGELLDSNGMKLSLNEDISKKQEGLLLNVLQTMSKGASSVALLSGV